MRQHFSVTVHPHLPLALCSDGYNVTELKLPCSTSPEDAAKTIVHSVQRLLSAEHPEVSLHLLPEEDTADATITRGGNLQAQADGSFMSSDDHATSSASAFGVGGAEKGIFHFVGVTEHSTGDDGTNQILSRSSAHVPASTQALDLLLSALGCVVSSTWPLEPPEHAASKKVPTLASFQSLWTDTCGAAVRLASRQGNMAALSDFLSRLQELTKFDSIHQNHFALTSSLLASTLNVCVECCFDHLKQQLSHSSDPSQTVAMVLNVLHVALDALSHCLGACSSAGKGNSGDTAGCTPILMDASKMPVLPALVSVFNYFYSCATDTLHLLEQYHLENRPNCPLLQATDTLQHLIEQLVQEAEQRGIPTPQPLAPKGSDHPELCALLGKLLQYNISGAVKDVALQIRTIEGLPIEGLGQLFCSTATQTLVTHRQRGSLTSPVGNRASPTQITSAATCMVRLADPVGESMVRTLGFLMARYFLSLPLMVPSLDCPCNLPAPSVAITQLPQGARFGELSSAKVRDAVKEQYALQSWSPECALVLLLFASEWEEAALFCLQLGNWQLAYSVASLEKTHNALLQCNMASQSDALLDDIAIRIMRCKIEAVTKALVSSEAHTRAIADKEHSLAMLLEAAAVGCHDNLVLQLATHLVASTVSEVGKLPCLVSVEHHLPGSPVFCQQQPFTKEVHVHMCNHCMCHMLSFRLCGNT